MRHKARPRNFLRTISLIAFLLQVSATAVWARATEKVLHEFASSKDGSIPASGLIFDKSGNLYGTTAAGGTYGDGILFELTPNSEGGWTENILYTFMGEPGVGPSSLVLDARGNLYGTTYFGGANGDGTVYELTPAPNGTWTESVLYTFTGGSDGSEPDGGLVLDAAGNLYGVTLQGGSYGHGTVFELAAGSGSWIESVLYAFATGSDGEYPVGNLAFDSNGNLYGTTSQGGAPADYCPYGSAGCGTVFELSPIAGGQWSKATIYSFCSVGSCHDGEIPVGGVVLDKLGNVYGTTDFGGFSNLGTVFRLRHTLGSWTETSLFSFNTKEGYDPSTLAFDAAGNLFGAAEAGGLHQDAGSVIEVPYGSDTGTVIYNFTRGAGGYEPSGSFAIDSSGNLFGTTALGGPHNAGTTFKLTSSAGYAISVLHNFSAGPDGASPHGGLIFDSAGDLYGTTVGGGTHSVGTAFELTPNSNGSWTEHQLFAFSGNDGEYPYGGLASDSAGNLYGTTQFGGVSGYGCPPSCGTVFELTPTPGGGWTESVLHAFTAQGDGGDPMGGLIVDAAGNLYGTTTYDGNVFELTPSSGGWSLAVLASDNETGYQGGLLFDTAGNLYGIGSGGSLSHGVVFELTPNSNGAWTQTSLYTFTGGSDGGEPTGSLILDTAGNLYGTTVQGGAYGHGTVFELTRGSSDWTENVLYSFTGGSDGSEPLGGVAMDGAGKLYGTTSIGGSTGCYAGEGCGVVFKLSQTKTGWKEGVLFTFRAGSGGGVPQSPLILDSLGNLYGSAGFGSFNEGVVFEVTP